MLHLPVIPAEAQRKISISTESLLSLTHSRFRWKVLYYSSLFNISTVVDICHVIVMVTSFIFKYSNIQQKDIWPDIRLYLKANPKAANVKWSQQVAISEQSLWWNGNIWSHNCILGIKFSPNRLHSNTVSISRVVL